MPGTATGYTGTVIFDGRWITIVRRGFTGVTTVGKGEKRIPLSSVTAVQFKPAGPTALQRGYIEFTVPGGTEARSRVGWQLMDAAYNENAVVFKAHQQHQFLMLRDDVEAVMSAQHDLGRATAPPAQTVADQIRQLGELRDQGLLSADEFQTQKAMLLARM